MDSSTLQKSPAQSTSEKSDTRNSGRRTEGCLMQDLSIENITVYLDKAEITRSTKFEVFASQQLELTLEQLPATIDRDSIRVDVQGSASISDVSFSVRPGVGLSGASSADRLVAIGREMKALKTELTARETRKSRYDKQKSVLDAFADTLLLQQQNDGMSENKAESMADVYNPKHLDTVRSFFELFNDKGQKFDEAIQDTSLGIQEIENKVALLKIEQRDIELRMDQLMYRELTLMVECNEDEEIEILLSYVVRNCSWSPIYDVRVSSKTGSMQICYYAEVRQSSSEDWYQPSSFSVSTTEPALGGVVPEVAVQRVQFRSGLEPVPEGSQMAAISPVLPRSPIKKSPTRLTSLRKSKSPSLNLGDHGTFSSLSPSYRMTGSVRFPLNENLENCDGSMDANASQHGNDVTVAKVTNAGIKSQPSVTYKISRPPSLVQCDNNPIKVMIGVVTLDPVYTHVTLPRLAQHAYQRAACKNTSTYTFLSGPASLYADSCFIGQTQLKTIYSCEDFICNLGADKQVVVGYQPLIKVNDPGGHGKSVTATYKQEIRVTNNHERPIKITVIDQVPLPMEGEKIKVNILEPSTKSDKQKHIRKNDLGHIEWDHELGAKATKEMVLKFSIEHPTEREIEIIQFK